ncbi:MAG: DUF3656 domain-containing protein [Rubrobacteridae bacterium]|nr:DUF3656 domain-containing protein [Rubrobacteridae bacterium]
MNETFEKNERKKIELLAPAGNMKSFEAALNGGADAIYLGIERFSARRGAGNFSIEELSEAVDAAHMRNAKVYVAFNTIIADEELPDASRGLFEIYNSGADAVIVQDWGLFDFIKKTLPELPVHASTQMNAHNKEMVRFIKDHGAKRVTLARELSVEEIADICDSTSMEVECFIHGALCFSYSGQCLFSSMVGNRSGNRGMCPQACRLSYDLGDNRDVKSVSKKQFKKAAARKPEKEISAETVGKHLMSTRDLCGITLIPRLADAGVTALKIEGRMKSPEYVAIVTNTYRRAIDRYYADPNSFKVGEDEIGELNEVFSRGFTEGYLSGIKDSGLMSYEKPSDRGVFIGRVTYLDVYKARLGLELKNELVTGDEIEAWVSQGGRIKIKVKEMFVNGKKTDVAPAGSKVSVTVSEKRHKINTGDRVFRTHSEKIGRKAKQIMSGSESRRLPIQMRAVLKIGEPVEIEAGVVEAEENSAINEGAAVGVLSGGNATVVKVKSEFNVEVGEHRTLSEEDVIAQLNRLGNTVYEAVAWDIDVEPGAMISLGKLNELRREVIEKLDKVRLGNLPRHKLQVKKAPAALKEYLNDGQSGEKKRPSKKTEKPVLSVDVSSFEQAERAAINGADWIYLRPGFSRSDLFNSLLKTKRDTEDFINNIADLKSAHGIKVALAISNILHDKELERYIELIEKTHTAIDGIITDNFGLIGSTLPAALPLFSDYHINVFNIPTARFLQKEGVSKITLSSELTLDQVANIIQTLRGNEQKGSHEAKAIETELLVHGWLEVMTTEHCVPSASKQSCSVCKSRSFTVTDEKGFVFPVEQDENCRSHIYNSHELFLLSNMRNLKMTGVSSLRLLLNRYSAEDAGKATSLYREAIDAVMTGSSDLEQIVVRASKSLPSLQQTTSGHYFRAIQ